MKSTKKLAVSAVLLSLALALSYTERFIPLQLLIPLPGVKLGLANIVTIISLYCLEPGYTFAIVILRSLMGSLFSGGITSFLFSLFGGLLSAVLMTYAVKCKYLSVYGVSILGAAAHNLGQICAAAILMKSFYVAAYFPYLLIVGIFTGFAVAAVSAGILKILSSVL